MTRQLQILLLCSVLLLGFSTRLRAGLDETVGTYEGQGITVKVTGPSKKVPSDGCFFCWVTIQNHSGAPRTWSVQGSVGDRRDRGARLTVSRSVRVENEASARIPILLPLVNVGSKSYYYQSVSLRVNGYGVESPEVSLGYGGGKQYTCRFHRHG